jgi:hypothetical protein
MTDGYVYAMWRNAAVSQKTGCVKIGYSTEPQRRQREHGAQLLAMAPGDKADARRVQSHLREWHLTRHWFVPSQSVMDWVASLPTQVSAPPEGWVQPVVDA